MRQNTNILNEIKQTQKLTLTPADNKRLAILCGFCDEHLKQLENTLPVIIKNRGNQFEITGEASVVDRTSKILVQLYEETKQKTDLNPTVIHAIIQEMNHKPEVRKDGRIPQSTRAR